MRFRRLRILLSLLTIATALALLAAAWHEPREAPGLQGRERTLLRIWITGSPGGGQAWLTGQLRAFERLHPGVSTHLRIVSPEEAADPEAVLPDVLLFLPGDVADPAALLTPLPTPGAIRSDVLRAGQLQGVPYALPLCWGAWVMAVDGSLEPEIAATPAPTTLLGRPAATTEPTAAPGYPLDAAAQAEVPLRSPGGAALLSMCALLPSDARPPTPEGFAHFTSAQVYAAFRARQCATAMLTTGQATAFSALTAAGQGFPFRIIVPDTLVTDQVWMAGLTRDAPPLAGELLAFLTAPDAQLALTAQGLHTVRDDLTLYAAGTSRQVEQAAARGIHAINAYLPASAAQEAAWRVFQGALTLTEVLASLL